MYSWQHWLNHVTEYEDRYKETTNSDGTVTHTPEPLKLHCNSRSTGRKRRFCR